MPNSYLANDSLWSLRRSRPDPLGFLTALAARGDFVPFKLAGRQAVFLNRPDYFEDVLVSHSSTFVKSGANLRATQLLGTGLLTADGPLHAERRRVLQPAFSRPRMGDYVSTMSAHVERMERGWTDGGVIDLHRTMGELTFGIVGDTVVGADVTRLFEDVRTALHKATASRDPLVSLLAPLRGVRGQQAALQQMVQRLMAAARQSTPTAGSLLSLLSAGATSGDAQRQASDDLLTILLAGHDTLANGLTWAWSLIARHPEVEARLRHEAAAVIGDRAPTAADLPKLIYARAVLSESLRLYPPAWVLARQAVEPFRMDEGVIPRGALVLVSQYVMQRDARYFANPVLFDPVRWLEDSSQARPRMAYFPFGAGGRACIGEALAWMEGTLILARVAQRWRLRPTASAFPDCEPRVTLRPKGPVAMRVERVRT